MIGYQCFFFFLKIGKTSSDVKTVNFFKMKSPANSGLPRIATGFIASNANLSFQLDSSTVSTHWMVLATVAGKCYTLCVCYQYDILWLILHMEILKYHSNFNFIFGRLNQVKYDPVKGRNDMPAESRSKFVVISILIYPCQFLIISSNRSNYDCLLKYRSTMMNCHLVNIITDLYENRFTDLWMSEMKRYRCTISR